MSVRVTKRQTVTGCGDGDSCASVGVVCTYCIK